MKTHTYHVGQHVHVRGLLLPTNGLFEVTARLPADDSGEPQYRVKAFNESHECMVKEFQLAPAEALHASGVFGRIQAGE
jgi:hypothetical protein